MLNPTRPSDAVGTTLPDIAGPIPGMFGRALAQDSAAQLAVDGGRLTHTYGDVAAMARHLQQRLAAEGVGCGSVVSLQLPNWSETVAAYLAAWGLGAVVNPIPLILRERDLAAVLALAEPTVLLSPAGHGDGLQAARARSAVTELGLTCPVLEVARGEIVVGTDQMILETGDVDDIALLMFTSGTTGRPKGVLHSHRTLLYETESIARTFRLEHDVIFMPSPLGHITGLLYGVLLPLMLRTSVVLLDRWNPDDALTLIEDQRCSFTVAATPFLDGLMHAYRRAGGSSSLRTFVCGGADIPAKLVADAEEVMRTEVFRTYGLTEMPTLCVGRTDDEPQSRRYTEGRVIGDARARIGKVVDPSGIGELEVIGPELFLGYLDPADNESAFTRDGWFKTGDLASIADTGHITIKGRIKDVIVRGGENISAKEVEDLLLRMPEIRDVALVGVPDPSLGERAAAVVVGASRPVSRSEITAHLESSGIARQKFPEIVLNVQALPRTASGKVQKFLLRAQLIEALDSGLADDRRALAPQGPTG